MRISAKEIKGDRELRSGENSPEEPRLPKAERPGRQEK
jgi:hypothetical protein